MRRLFAAAALIAAATSASGADTCPAAALGAAREAKWVVADDAQRQSLALASVDCLSSPDPVWRDELAFEALQAWMRTDKLSTTTVQSLRTTLQARLAQPDQPGFAQPFAALVLADVARVDRVKPYLAPAQRSELVAAATGYLAQVRDYRGFDEKAGWRHGVAHGADLMLQLALNPALGKAELEQLMSAIASQVVPANAHFYQYGEGERLMAPVFYLSRRDAIACEAWDAWLARLAAGGPPAQTQAALARRHNLKSFLMPLYVNINESKDARQRACMLPLVLRSLKQADA